MMTDAAVAALLANGATSVCVRIQRREDGSVVTRTPARGIGWWMRRVFVAVVSWCGLGTQIGCDRQSSTMGKPAPTKQVADGEALPQDNRTMGKIDFVGPDKSPNKER
jgi:hypothetical protein